VWASEVWEVRSGVNQSMESITWSHCRVSLVCGESRVGEGAYHSDSECSWFYPIQNIHDPVRVDTYSGECTRSSEIFIGRLVEVSWMASLRILSLEADFIEVVI